MKIEKFTEQSTQNPSEPKKKDYNRKAKEKKESDNPMKNEPKKEVDFLDIHRGSVYSMDFLSQEKIIATGSNDKSVKLTHRVYPQDENTEGFFIAKLRKLK